MRHGDAPYISGERQLSESGHKQVKRMAVLFEQQLTKLSVKLDLVLTSPLLRAQQTADTLEASLSDKLGYQWKRQNEALLKPESESSITIPYIEEVTEGNVILISHMPLVSSLWSAWLHGESQYFPTASIGCITLDRDKNARKVSFQSPDMYEF